MTIADFRQGIRRLLRDPLVFSAAVLCIGGSAAGTAILLFSVDAILFRPPLHVERAEEVVRVEIRSGTHAGWASRVSYPAFRAIQQGLGAELPVAAYTSRTILVRVDSEPVEVAAELVTDTYFDLLRVGPARGRMLSADDVDHEPVAVVSHRFAEDLLGGREVAPGRPILIAGRVFTVVGVAPQGFGGIERQRIDVWLPLAAAAALVDRDWLTSPTQYWLSVLARIPPVARPALVRRAEVLLADGEPEYDDRLEVALRPVIGNDPTGRPQQARMTGWLAAASLLLLIAACANIANLLLVRYVMRDQELVTRAALGARTRDLLRVITVEISTIAVAAFILAVLIVHWAGEAVQAFLVPGLEISKGVLDTRLLLHIAALVLVSSVACAVPGAMYIWRIRLGGGPPRGLGPVHKWFSRGLVAVQCSLAVVLLVGASLFSRSFRNVTDLDLGFDTERVLYATIHVDGQLSRADLIDLYERLAQNVARLEGVSGVTVAMGLPLRNAWGVAMRLPEDVWPGPNPVVLGRAAGSDFFPTTGLRILQGRAFEPDEYAASARVAIINEAFAKEFWERSDPIGSCVWLGSDSLCTRIVGVAVNTPRWSITSEREHEIYIPMRRTGALGMKDNLALAIRTTSESDRMIAPVRAALEAAGQDVSYAEVVPVRALVRSQTEPWRKGATLFGFFGAAAVILATLGLYATLSFLVVRQQREIGIRMAIGASPARILHVVLRGAARIYIPGAMIGLAAAAVLGRWAEPLLFRVSALEVGTYILAGLLVVSIGLAASLLPALRAARLDSATLLRET
jgi:putative ABC transport system permease protein